MANWRLAKSLTQLRKQINEAYPGRSKVSDGTIGDAAHSARTSDHNPDTKNRVCAIDITHDPAKGVDGKELCKSLIADSRMKYVIFAGKIFKARTGKWETYTGPNKHHKHVHLSVNQEGADDSRPWTLDVPKDKPAETKAEAREIAGDNAPEPVVEQPKDPPPKEINAQTATTVNASKPGIWGQISSISIPAGLTTILATVGKVFMGIPPWVWGMIIVVGLLVAAYLWNEKRKRAHERTLAIAQIAADPEANNVYIGGGENK